MKRTKLIFLLLSFHGGVMAVFMVKSPRDCIILSYYFEYINIFLTPRPTCPIPVFSVSNCNTIRMCYRALASPNRRYRPCALERGIVHPKPAQPASSTVVYFFARIHGLQIGGKNKGSNAIYSVYQK